MRVSKRFFDITFSFIGLILLFPFFVLIVLLIKLKDGNPIFFKQERVGYKGKPFYIWKFRTMIVNAEKSGRQITIGKDPRITAIGYYLRKFKLDELPQLFNVLKGEMSFVGPRPEVPKYVFLYNENQRQVLQLKPGITDIASIRYYNENDILAQAPNPDAIYREEIMPEKIRLNLEYAKNANLWTDFLVVLQTIFPVIKKLNKKDRGAISYGPGQN